MNVVKPHGSLNVSDIDAAVVFCENAFVPATVATPVSDQSTSGSVVIDKHRALAAGSRGRRSNMHAV